MNAPVPRQSLAWFFAAQIAVIAPHALRLPWWLLGVWMVCAAWRIQAFRGRWSYPGKMAKTLAVTVVLGGILAWYRNPAALESAVGTVIALFFLKLLECHTRRDVYLLTFVGMFVSGTAFLFDQGMLTALAVFLSMALLLASLLALHDPAQAVGVRGLLRDTGLLLGQALPLMLVLFLVFPRIAPIWSVPVPGGGTAHTGMSDSMSPGDFTRLGRSAEVAFRATFAGPVPAREDLYWRSLVLEDFDGRTWRMHEPLPLDDAARVRAAVRALEDIDPATELHYDILMEPSDAQWLFSLEHSLSHSDGVISQRDGTLASRTPVTSRFAYQVTSYRTGKVLHALDPAERKASLRLPANINPRTRAWAQSLRSQYPQDADLVQAVLGHFREQPFVYTLEPPALGRHSVDEFLFDSRRGFCEHYAGSTAFLLRAAGIPARVVVGYQGGETNPFRPYLLVHQYDAHAWVETWIAGEGWVRIDPTAMVAPNRIDLGMEASMGQDRGFLADSFTASLWHRNAWLGQVRLWFDQVDYRWQQWVLGYDSDRQVALLTRWLGEISMTRIITLMGSVLALVMGLALVSLWGREWLRPRDPLVQAWQRFCALGERQGLLLQSAETPAQYAQRWAAADPARGAEIRRIAALLGQLAYEPLDEAGRGRGLRELHAALRRLARKNLFVRHNKAHDKSKDGKQP